MTAFEALRVDTHPVDDELCDDGSVGPELSHLARVYRSSPRALVFRQPSSEWRLFVLVLPIATRLSLLANPVFTQLARAWGLNLRFIGVDRSGLVFDFRSALTDATLGLLLQWLRDDQAALGSRPPDPSGDHGLDILFATLARETLTVLEKRNDDWGRHLATHMRLEPEVENTLFDRSGRFPDFHASLRQALRAGAIDAHFYGRVLRSIDLREAAVEQRIGAQLEDVLDGPTLVKLDHAGAGKHLGCYNWLRLAPRHAAMRAHVLGRLPSFAGFMAESLLPAESWEPTVESVDDLFGDDASIDEWADARDLAHGARPALPAYDLRRVAARNDTLRHAQQAMRLRRAVDTGQDRSVIEVLALRFGVSENTIRLLWHDRPRALGQPPTWHLAEILRRLDALERRDWPRSDAQWRELMASAVPAEVA